MVEGSLVLVGTEVTAKLMGMVLLLAMARNLGAEEFGLYGFGIALSNTLLLLSNFGLERLVQRDVPRDPQTFPSLYPTLLLVKSALSLAALGLAVGLLFGVGQSSGRGWVLLVIFLASLGQSYLALNGACFKAFGRPWDEGVVRVGFSLLYSVLGLSMLSYGYGLPGVALALLLTSWGFLILSTTMICRRTGIQFGRIRVAECRAALRRAVPFFVLVVFLLLYTQLDVLLLGLIRGEAEVGFYVAAARLLEVLILIPTGVMGVFLPAMSRYYQTVHTGFQRTLEYTWKYLALLAIPAAVGTFVLADRVHLLLYGPAFAPSVTALKLLAWAIIPTFLSFIAFNTLISMGRERTLLAITVAGSLFTLLANGALIPVFGYLAPSAVVFWTQALVLALCLRQILRHGAGAVSLWTLGRLLVRPAVGAFLMGLLLSMLSGLPLAVVVILGAAGYFAFLFATGVFHDELAIGSVPRALPNREGASA
jgi:O-antigen/teichoic acid export membrane protein